MTDAPYAPPPPRKRTTWPYWLLGGCLLILIVVALVVVGSGVAIYSWGKGQVDPEQRERNTKEMLGATTLPPGYHAGVSISLGVARMARLSDVRIGEQSDLLYNERGFVFHDSLRTDPPELQSFLDGKSGGSFEEMGTTLRADEVLGGGTLTVNDQPLRYYARRGEVSQDGRSYPGLFSVITVDCRDNREKYGIWFQKVDPAVATADVPRAGSVIDENAIREFFSHFHVCK